MGWLRLVGSLKLQVSFAEYCLFYRALLQKRPIILRSLLIVATPYLNDVSCLFCCLKLPHVWMSHVPNMNESCPTWKRHLNDVSCRSCSLNISTEASVSTSIANKLPLEPSTSNGCPANVTHESCHLEMSHVNRMSLFIRFHRKRIAVRALYFQRLPCERHTCETCHIGLSHVTCMSHVTHMSHVT